ncbi:MAG: menaquinone biosynthetic enzyme MqnA/MqnD family protein [Planctomycetaceae bacterium]
MRYGGVSYLNARPLVEGLSELVLDTPAGLARRFQLGYLDVGLLPVAAGEALGLERVGSLGIAADGPVQSVLLFHACELAQVRRIALDPASRTSQALSLLILREAYGLDPEVVAAPRGADAELVIGDPALVRARAGGDYLDLAAEWKRLTGLPFVFAAWYGAQKAEADLEAAYARGAAKIPEYAREFGRMLRIPAEELEAYLRLSVRYRLGPREEEGLRLFREKAASLGLL